MKGRMAVLTEWDKPAELWEREVPDPEPGAIVLGIQEAGICGSDLHRWRGDLKEMALPEPGLAMGHEGWGRIAMLGKGVTSDSLGQPLREGDRVIHSAVFPCLRCYQCLRGELNVCPNGTVYRPVDQHPYFVGTMADYYYVPPNHPVFRVPDELPDEVLASINCAMGTVTQGLTVAGVHEGEYVVIQGAGGLGLSAAAVAKDMGAGMVIVLDRIPKRLETAKRFGADEVVNVDEFGSVEDRVAHIYDLTNGRGADLVVELVGLSELMPEGLQMVRQGGTFLEIGNIVRGSEACIEPWRLLRGRKIVGSVMYTPVVLFTVLAFLQKTKDRYPFDQMITHRYPLAEINEAFAAAEWSGRQTEVGRAALNP